MQPLAELKDDNRLEQPKLLLERLESLVEKNELAYNDAIRDFRDQFTLGSTAYDLECE